LILRCTTPLAVLLAACVTHRAVSDAAPAAPAVEVRAARGELVLSLTPRGAGAWTVVAGPVQATVRLDQGGAVAEDEAGRVLARVSPGPAGDVLTSAAGVVVARVVRPGGTAIDVLTPDGIGILRAAAGAPGAIGRDAAGVPTLTAAVDGDRIVLAARDGTRLGTVHHADDEVLALLLATDSLAPIERAALYVRYSRRQNP
jgi:hypothetical protein